MWGKAALTSGALASFFQLCPHATPGHSKLPGIASSNLSAFAAMAASPVASLLASVATCALLFGTSLAHLQEVLGPPSTILTGPRPKIQPGATPNHELAYQKRPFSGFWCNSNCAWQTDKTLLKVPYPSIISKTRRRQSSVYMVVRNLVFLRI